MTIGVFTINRIQSIDCFDKMCHKLTVFIVVVSNVCLISGADFKPDVKWCNQLSSGAELSDYLKSRAQMARAFLFMNEQKPFVGMENRTGSLAFVDCMKTMTDRRRGHGLMLSVPDKTTLESSMYILKNYNVSWLWLHFDCMQGPNGAEPVVTPNDMTTISEQLPTAIRLSLGWTFNYRGTSQEYDLKKFIDAVQKVLENKNFMRYKLNFQLDAYFASKTRDIVKRFPIEELSAGVQAVFYTTPDQELDVNVNYLRSLIHKINPYYIYLNIPPVLHSELRIVPKPTRNPSLASRLRQSTTITAILLWSLIVSWASIATAGCGTIYI